MVASTVLLLTPQVLAVSRLLWPHSQARRKISRIFRMVTRSLGILPSFNKIEAGKIPVEVTPRLHSQCVLAVFTGMVATFPSEHRPFSQRNGGRFPAGTLAVLGRNTQLTDSRKALLAFSG
jgi:hypothetical protein